MLRGCYILCTGERFTASPEALLAHTAPNNPAALTEHICTVCEVYKASPALAAAGTHVTSTDEMTGNQAFERLHPSLPLLQCQLLL